VRKRTGVNISRCENAKLRALRISAFKVGVISLY